MTELTRDGIIAAAKVAADTKGTKSLSRKDFERLTRIGNYHIYRHFPDGVWSEVVRLAGLEQHPMHNEPVSDEALLREFHTVASAIGRLPTWHQLGSQASFSPDTFRKRFGGLPGTREHYRVWLELHEPDSPLLATLRSSSGVRTAPAGDETEPSKNFGYQWPKRAGIQHGPPLSFRGLRHGPVNEQGVVYLFGMVSNELGFLVEAIHGPFPDCIAKRSIDGKGDRWQQVLIEFEYRSSNFREHNHDPNACDVIVCWEHDWPDCPLEVIELRSIIQQLLA